MLCPEAYLMYKRGGEIKSNAATVQAPVNDLKEKEEGGDRLRKSRTGASSVQQDIASSDKTTFTWKKINYTVNGFHLLHDVEGYAKAGQITALMGASGSGKTT
jgi:ATP-binding cassette subfamily G (WHITE) protein 2 (SNQ2)